MIHAMRYLMAIAFIYKMTIACTQVITVPADIDGTGKKNVTADLNRFFASVPDGSKVVFAQEKIYRIEETLRIKHKTNLIIDGNNCQFVTETIGKERLNSKGRPIKNSQRSRVHLSIENCQMLKIANLKIVGPHKAGGAADSAYVRRLEAQHGVNVYASKNILIDNVDIRYVYGDCIYIGDGKGQFSSDSILIKNSFFGFNGRQGIALTYASAIVIDSCEFSQIRRTHIDLETNNVKASVKDVTISNCTFGISRLNWISAVGGGNTSDIYVVNNTIVNKPPTVTIGTIRFSNFGPFYFRDNTANAVTATGHGAVWRLTNVNGFYAVENQVVVKGSRKMYLVSMARCTDVYVNNNNVIGGDGQLKVQDNRPKRPVKKK